MLREAQNCVAFKGGNYTSREQQKIKRSNTVPESGAHITMRGKGMSHSGGKQKDVKAIRSYVPRPFGIRKPSHP